MTASGKTQITISTHDQDSHFPLPERVFLAETLLHSLRTGMYTLLEFRIVVPTADAEALVEGIISGDAELFPVGRTRPAGHPVLDLKQVAKNSPPELLAWFYPGDRKGQEFVYPKVHAAMTAKAGNKGM
jgi:hypothetical protein